jgi:hypothetical protein
MCRASGDDAKIGAKRVVFPRAADIPAARPRRAVMIVRASASHPARQPQT